MMLVNPFKFKLKDKKPVREILSKFEADHYNSMSRYAYVPLYKIRDLSRDNYFLVECDPSVADFIRNHSWDKLEIDEPIDLAPPYVGSHMRRWFTWLDAWAKNEHEKQLKEQSKMSDERVYLGVDPAENPSYTVGYLKSLGGSPQQNQWRSPCQTIWGSQEAIDSCKKAAQGPLGANLAERLKEKLEAEKRITQESEALERERQESLNKDVKGIKCVSAAVIFSNRPHEEGGDVNGSALTIKIRKDRYHNWGLEHSEPVYTLIVENLLESDDHQYHQDQVVCAKITHSEKEDIIRMLSSI